MINFEKLAYSKVRFLQKRTPMASIYSEWNEPGNDFRPKRKRSLGKISRNHAKFDHFTWKLRKKNFLALSFEGDRVNLKKVKTENAVCAVCLRPSNGFHYSVQSCEGCKGFCLSFISKNHYFHRVITRWTK